MATKEQEDAILEGFFKEQTIEQMAADMAPRAVRATELMDADPKMPYISAFIIAGDQIAGEERWKLLEMGVSYDRVEPFIGSYARLAFALRAMDEGYLSQRRLIEKLPDLWSFSDSGGYSPRWLELWRLARSMNGGYVRSAGGRPLPKGKKLTAYRGQDFGARLGIAWSLDPKVAERFARGAATRQRDRGGRIFRATVPREDVLAYLTTRGESEIIIDPTDLDVQVKS